MTAALATSRPAVLCPPPSCGSHRLCTFTGTCVSINLLKFFLGPWQIQMHKRTAVPEMTREPGIYERASACEPPPTRPAVPTATGHLRRLPLL